MRQWRLWKKVVNVVVVGEVVIVFVVVAHVVVPFVVVVVVVSPFFVGGVPKYPHEQKYFLVPTVTGQTFVLA